MSLNANASLKQLEASDPASTVWVNANAGSGKTHVLVDRVIRLLLGGADPARVMCLTFTKAAAAEMASRLFERLSQWIVLDDAELAAQLAALGSQAPDGELLERARQLFTRALETPGGLKIQTIHAFCERVLQLFPVEAGIVPHFSMLDERQSRELLQQARNRILAEAQAQPQSPLGEALRDVANRTNPDAFDKLLGQVLKERASLRGLLDPEHGMALAEAQLRQHLLVHGVTASSIHGELRLDAARYAGFAQALDTGNARDIERGAILRDALKAADPSLLDLREFYLTKENEPRKAGIANKPVKDRHPWLADFVAGEQQRLISGLGRLADLERISATLSVLRIGSAIVTAFEHAKRHLGSYDFDDLIIRTGELLHERPDAAWVLYKLDGGIEHLLVDEAQDTSPAQWAIIRALTDEFFAGEGRHGRKARTVFVVGDRKQSIYSFQGADPDVFELVHDDFRQSAGEADREFRDVDLTVSFRSAPEILQAVDAVFHTASPARLGLDGRSPRDWHHESNRRQASGLVEVWPLTEPLDAPVSDPWLAPVDREPAQSPRRRLARELARTIKGWLGRRLIPALGRPVRAEDVLILVRSRNSFFDAMIRALWNERVPVAGADRLKLGENIAVLDLLALAQFCIMPEDDHALACVLKSPILATPLGEDELLAVAAGRGPRFLWDSLCGNSGAPFVGAAEALGHWRAQAPGARPFEFFSAVLMAARARFLARLGSEANDALDALLDMALSYEESHGSSLAGFVNWFVGGEIEIRRNMELGSGEVRIMTVHGAKGLEAPIVILPDTVSMPDHRNADPLIMLRSGNANAKVPLWPVPKLFESAAMGQLNAKRQESQLHEYQRLLYVAMTRARDELYICGYKGANDAPPGCWYNTVSGSLKPMMAEIAGGKGWRLGREPATQASPQAAPAPDAARLPGWISQLAAAQHEPPHPATRPARASGRVARGILIHRILQQLPDLPEVDRPRHIARVVARSGHDLALAGELAALVMHQAFAELFSPDGLSEVPLMTDVPGLGPQRRRIDRLVMTETGILVADYKTDRDWPRDPAGVHPEYLAQMAGYRAALRRIHPGVPLRLALLWTEAPNLMIIPDALMDRMADQLSVTRP